MAKAHKRKEKDTAAYLGFSWVRDQAWDAEGFGFDGEAWKCEIKSEELPNGGRGFHSVVNRAWDQLTERMEERGVEAHRLVAYVPTRTGPQDGWAMFVFRGLRVMLAMDEFKMRFIDGEEASK